MRNKERAPRRVLGTVQFAFIIYAMVKAIKFAVWNVKNVYYFRKNRKR